MDIPKTPFMLNDNDLVYDVEVQSTGDIVFSNEFLGGHKIVYPDCDIKDCGGFAFYNIGCKKTFGDGRIYTQNVCEHHLLETINRLGIKEEIKCLEGKL